MPKKLDKEIVFAKIIEMYPDQIVDFSSYENTNSKIKMIDPIYGEWFPSVHNLISKKREHTKRANRKARIKIDVAIERIKNVHGETIKIDESTYIGVNYKCRFIDCEYGEFFAKPFHVFRGMKHRRRAIVENSTALILPIDEVKRRLKKIGEEITIDENTYVSLYKKARFVHTKYGEWWATPNNVIRHLSSHPDGATEKSISTFLKKYGTKNPMQNRDVFVRTSKSRWRKVVLSHWKTQEDVVCTSSYEFAVVSTLNEKKIDYNWQIKFSLPSFNAYFVDLYIIEKDTYIEIKGFFFNERNKNKWEEFHSMYKNSEIWFIDNVKAFTGKSEHKIKKEFADEYKRKNT